MAYKSDKDRQYDRLRQRQLDSLREDANNPNNDSQYDWLQQQQLDMLHQQQFDMFDEDLDSPFHSLFTPKNDNMYNMLYTLKNDSTYNSIVERLKVGKFTQIRAKYEKAENGDLVSIEKMDARFTKLFTAQFPSESCASAVIVAIMSLFKAVLTDKGFQFVAAIIDDITMLRTREDLEVTLKSLHSALRVLNVHFDSFIGTYKDTIVVEMVIFKIAKVDIRCNEKKMLELKKALYVDNKIVHLKFVAKQRDGLYYVSLYNIKGYQQEAEVFNVNFKIRVDYMDMEHTMLYAWAKLFLLLCEPAVSYCFNNNIELAKMYPCYIFMAGKGIAGINADKFTQNGVTMGYDRFKPLADALHLKFEYVSQANGKEYGYDRVEFRLSHK